MIRKIVHFLNGIFIYLIDLLYLVSPRQQQIALNHDDTLMKKEAIVILDSTEIKKVSIKKKTKKHSKKARISSEKVSENISLSTKMTHEDTECLIFDGLPSANEIKELQHVRSKFFKSSKEKKVPFKEVILEPKSEKIEDKKTNTSLIIFKDDKNANIFADANKWYLDLLQELHINLKDCDKPNQKISLRKLYFYSIQVLESLMTALIKRSAQGAPFSPPLMSRIKIFRNIMAHRFDRFLSREADIECMLFNFFEKETSFFDYIVSMYKLIENDNVPIKNMPQQIKQSKLQEQLDSLLKSEFLSSMVSIGKNEEIKNPFYSITQSFSQIIFTIKKAFRYINEKDNETLLKTLFIEVGSLVRLLKAQHELSGNFKKIFKSGIQKVSSQDLLINLLKTGREGTVEDIEKIIEKLSTEQVFGLMLMLRHCYLHHESQGRYKFTYNELDKVLPILGNHLIDCLTDIKNKAELAWQLEENSSTLSIALKN